MSDLTDLEALRTWLMAAKAAAGEGEDSLDIGLLSEDELDVVAVDLDGILEASSAVEGVLRSLVEASPTRDYLQTQLIEVEVDLNHALWHWRSLARVLRAKDLWMDDLTLSEGTLPGGGE